MSLHRRAESLGVHISKESHAVDMEAQHNHEQLPVYTRYSRPSSDPTKWVMRILAAIGVLYMVQKAALFYIAQQPDRLSSLSHQLHVSNTSHPIDGAVTHNVHNHGQQKAIVVASLAKENTSWIHENFPDFQLNIYVVDDQKADYTVLKEGGHEAAVFLTYIINHYYSLPDVMIFSHAKRYQWHNDDPMFDGVPAMRQLQIPYLLREGYASLRCTWEPGCPQNVKPLANHLDDWMEADGETANVYQDWFPERELPDHLGAPCCAQFAVSREQVLLRPVQTYERIRQWLWTTDRISAVSGRVLEYLWHVVFSKPDVVCPTTESCNCEKFGLCELNCPKDGWCEGRWYTNPFGLDIPVDWPMNNDNPPKGIKPWGWWQEFYPNETFGFEWMQDAKYQSHPQIEASNLTASAKGTAKATMTTTATATAEKNDPTQKPDSTAVPAEEYRTGLSSKEKDSVN